MIFGLFIFVLVLYNIISCRILKFFQLRLRNIRIKLRVGEMAAVSAKKLQPAGEGRKVERFTVSIYNRL